MTTTPALATKLDILKETRELFANTHWTSGDLYTTDSNGKKQFCMVGGLCHVLAKNNLPEWLQNEERKVEELGYGKLSFYLEEIERSSSLRNYDSERFIAGLDAEWELAKTIVEEEYGEGPIDPELSPGEVENIVVNWNDGPADKEFEERGDASYVLEVMDKTIRRVEAEQDG
jgi:hypothetical protein